MNRQFILIIPLLPLIIPFSNSLSVPFRAEGQIQVEETPVEAFGRSDANNDGKLDFEEFMHTDALFEALKMDEFKQLDANSDGRVSREEYYPSGGWYRGFWRGQSGNEPQILTGKGRGTERGGRRNAYSPLATDFGDGRKIRIEKRAKLKGKFF